MLFFFLIPLPGDGLCPKTFRSRIPRPGRRPFCCVLSHPPSVLVAFVHSCMTSLFPLQDKFFLINVPPPVPGRRGRFFPPSCSVFLCDVHTTLAGPRLSPTSLRKTLCPFPCCWSSGCQFRPLSHAVDLTALPFRVLTPTSCASFCCAAFETSPRCDSPNPHPVPCRPSFGSPTTPIARPPLAHCSYHQVTTAHPHAASQDQRHFFQIVISVAFRPRVLHLPDKSRCVCFSSLSSHRPAS